MTATALVSLHCPATAEMLAGRRRDAVTVATDLSTIREDIAALTALIDCHSLAESGAAQRAMLAEYHEVADLLTDLLLDAIL